MSTDYGEKERQFLASLEADTGRDLAGWMRAIDEEDLTRRNDIIDWLRRQGFMFSKASWLERIHNNGGQPIYGDGTARRATAGIRRRRVAAPTTSAAPVERGGPEAPAAPVTPPSSAAILQPGDASALDALLAKAKAFRPLASYVLAEIRKAVPEVRITAEEAHISLAHHAEFAVLTLSPKELRLGLRLGDRPVEAPFSAARFPAAVPRIAPFITHMVILTDARQVDGALLRRVAEAAAAAA